MRHEVCRSFYHLIHSLQRKAGKILHLTHLSSECRLLLKTAKHLVEVNVLEDPQYHVAIDKAKARIEGGI